MYSANGEFKKMIIENFQGASTTATADEEKMKKEIEADIEKNKPPPPPETEEDKKNKRKLKNMQNSSELAKKYGRGFTILEAQSMVNYVKEAVLKAKMRIDFALNFVNIAIKKRLIAEVMSQSNKMKYTTMAQKSKMNSSVSRGGGGGASAAVIDKEPDKVENLKLLTEAKALMEKVEPFLREAEVIMNDSIVVRYAGEVEAFTSFCRNAFNPPALSEEAINNQLEKFRTETDPDLQHIDESTYKYYYYSASSIANKIAFVKDNIVKIRKQVDDVSQKHDGDVARITEVYTATYEAKASSDDGGN